jgi:hypothetical protein
VIGLDFLKKDSSLETLLIFLLRFSVTIFPLLAKRDIHSVAHHEEGVAEIFKVLTED